MTRFTNRVRAVCAVAVAAMVVFAGTALAATHIEEDWEGYTQGDDFCDVNIGEPWVCVDNIVTLVEHRQAELGQSPPHSGSLTHILDLNIFTVNRGDVEETAPHMYIDLDSVPTTNYTVYAHFLDGGVARNESGNFVIFRLSNSGGTNFLDIGFRDADHYLDITNGTGWDETNFSSGGGGGAAGSWYNYTVTLDLNADSYRIVVKDFATPPVEQLNTTRSLQNIDTAASRLTVGSLSNRDKQDGYWDDIAVFS